MMGNESFYSQPGGAPLQAIRPPPGLNPVNHSFTHMTPTRLSSNPSGRSDEFSDSSARNPMSTSQIVGENWESPGRTNEMIQRTNWSVIEEEHDMSILDTGKPKLKKSLSKSGKEYRPSRKSTFAPQPPPMTPAMMHP